MKPLANGAAPAAQPQPIAVIQVALFPNEQVAVQLDGQVNDFRIRGMLAAGLPLALQVLQKMLAAKHGGIEVPTPEQRSVLLGGG